MMGHDSHKLSLYSRLEFITVAPIFDVTRILTNATYSS